LNSNYPNLFLAKPQDNPSLGRRLHPQDATIFTYINNQDDFLYHSSRGGKLEERAIIRAEFCHRSQQQRLTAYASLAAEQRTQIDGQTALLGGGRFVTASGEAWFTYSCKALVVKAREVKKCMTALPITLSTKQYIEYLAIRRGPTNIITDAKLIETLRQNASLFVEPQTWVITTIGTEIPCGGPFQPIYRNLNGRWIKTSPTLQISTTPVDGVKLTKEWEEVKPDDDRKFDFMYGGVYDNAAVRDIEEFFQTPRATMGVAISLSRQSIHSGLGAMEPGHLFTKLEDIEWTFWGQWADFVEKYRGPASITIFSLLCFMALTWAGGLCCRCVAMNELYN
jgi:hypothetical protein